MATGRVPTTANSPLTAKGDLFTYSTAPARLAVGSNGESLVADSSATTGLRYSAGVGFTQPVINGGMDVWQRGTSFALAANTLTFAADRWQGKVTGTVTNTYSRQTTSDTTNLPFIQYALRVQRTSGQTATPAFVLAQNIETANSIPFAGKTVALSFYARRGANFSSGSNLLTAELYSGTGTDQNIYGTWTGSATPISSNVTLTTTWQRFTLTGTVATTATELAVYFVHTPSGTAGADDWYEITGVQLDVGSVALPFRRSGGTIQGELAACQRYYFEDAKTSISNGYATNTYFNFDRYFHPVAMRTTPTITQTGAVAFSSNTSATTYSIDANGSNQIGTNMYFQTGASNGLTYLYRPVQFSAEL